MRWWVLEDIYIKAHMDGFGALEIMAALADIYASDGRL